MKLRPPVEPVLVFTVAVLVGLLIAWVASNHDPKSCEQYATYPITSVPMRCASYFYDVAP